MNKLMKMVAISGLIFACVGFQAYASEATIKTGQNIDDVSNSMTKAGYVETGLDMEAASKESELKMWSVDEGVLIFAYSTKDNITTEITYYLCDERPKAIWKTFEFTVTEFAPNTKEMKIKLPNKQDVVDGK